jgi:hypothetical protein
MFLVMLQMGQMVNMQKLFYEYQLDGRGAMIHDGLLKFDRLRLLRLRLASTTRMRMKKRFDSI